jgi:hypothetical protein
MKDGLRDLGVRDNWTCHLCGGDVPKKHKDVSRPLHASTDHVIPAVFGGTRQTKALAHTWCNSARHHLPLHLATHRRALFAEGLALAVVVYNDGKKLPKSHPKRQALIKIGLAIREGMADLNKPDGSTTRPRKIITGGEIPAFRPVFRPNEIVPPERALPAMLPAT